jgi:hypothetical protein
MKTKQRFILVLILTILGVSQIGTISAADAAIMQVNTSDYYLKAGQENTITINMKNTGDYKLYDVEAFLTSTTNGLSVLSGAQTVYSEIDKGKTKSYEPVIYVDSSVALGAYSLSLNVIYRRFGAEQDSSITVPITVVVNEGYIPKIKFTPDLDSLKVKSGAENEVALSFTNNWDHELVDIEFALSSSTSSISIIDDLSLKVGSLQPGEQATITPTISIVEGTPLSVYSITATASYQDADENRYYQTYSVPINVASASAVRNTILTIDEMQVVEETVQPGDIFTVQFTIKCTGADAYDLLGSINFAATSPISPISPSIVSIGDLDAGETTTVTYSLLASGSISAGQYPVTATISYTNNRGEPRTLTETMTVLIDGLIDFEFLDIPSELAAPGETKELEADLLLIGTESVEFVSIGVTEDDVIQRVSGSDEYIGAVDPDSPIPFDINYKIDPDAPEGEHELKLSVKYRDHLNREHEEQIGLDITIGEKVDDTPEPQQSGIWTWIRRLLGLGP